MCGVLIGGDYSKTSVSQWFSSSTSVGPLARLTQTNRAWIESHRLKRIWRKKEIERKRERDRHTGNGCGVINNLAYTTATLAATEIVQQPAATVQKAKQF